MKTVPFTPSGDPRQILALNRAFLSLLSKEQKQRLEDATISERFDEVAARRALKARPCRRLPR
jgi:hypothetical protein